MKTSICGTHALSRSLSRFGNIFLLRNVYQTSNIYGQRTARKYPKIRWHLITRSLVIKLRLLATKNRLALIAYEFESWPLHWVALLLRIRAPPYIAYSQKPAANSAA